MAWQNPKIDWSPADGVRDSDLNRIEGNLLELYNQSGRANTTVYVATTGDDSAGNGSSGQPYKTITKALQAIPKHLNGFKASINIAEGTYEESVVITGFTGIVELTGTGTVTVNSISIENCMVATTGLLTLKATGSFIVRNRGSLVAYGNLRAETGFTVRDCSSVTCTTLYGAGTYAISVYNASFLYASSLDGMGTSYGLYVIAGGVLSYDFSNVKGTSHTASGGRIYSGAQNNNINTMADAVMTTEVVSEQALAEQEVLYELS